MGVLSGIRVLEFEAIGPGPFGAMLLADMGADVLRIDRPAEPDDLGPKRAGERIDIIGRGRRAITLDLKQPEPVAAALDLIAHADVLIEGFRPGTMERLGLGPQVALARNPRLVYGRMTGWGQSGPLAPRAGHDLNYIALSGVLSGIGRAGEAPVLPLNLVGDYGGGGMPLALGVVAALVNVQRGGAGQVVDAAMIEGAAQLGSVVWGALAAGHWREQRESNLLDGGTPWYDSYRTRDAAIWRWARWKRAFTCSCSTSSVMPMPVCRSSTIAAAGRYCASVLRRRFSPARATNGARSSTAAMPASHPC